MKKTPGAIIRFPSPREIETIKRRNEMAAVFVDLYDLALAGQLDRHGGLLYFTDGKDDQMSLLLGKYKNDFVAARRSCRILERMVILLEEQKRRLAD